ncbi:MAG: protein-L-isoaspartate O-methyltransferase family protein [Janthinobacterium lividum]
MAGFASDLTRRAALLGAPMLGVLGAARASRAAPVNAESWTHEEFVSAMRRSGRPIEQSAAEFATIQGRRAAYLARIEEYLKARLGSADPAVMAAFRAVPREYFHYNYAERRAMPGEAYESEPKPWALGYGSALSDYLGQAYMTQICRPKPGDTTLEIGTGSGFQSSLLSRIVARAYSIEIIEPLGHSVDRIFAPLGYDNVEGRVGDGYFGWPEVRGGFDIIIVTCAAQYAPPALFAQLKPGGRMIIPIGQPFKRGQVLYVYTKDEDGKVHSRRDVGVFFIPMTGTMMDKPKPADAVVSVRAPAPVPATTAPAAAAPAVDAPAADAPAADAPAPAASPARP